MGYGRQGIGRKGQGINRACSKRIPIDIQVDAGQTVTGAFESSVVDAALAVNLDRVSALAIERARIGLSDAVGIAIAGSREPLAGTVRGFAAGTGARLWGTTLRAGAADAAWANGVAAHVLDWDDYSHPMYGHCSSVLTPVCFALAESLGRSGRELMEAWLAGHEVDARIGDAATVRHYRKGWHATSSVGVFGATASAARLLRLDAAQMTMALGIAASSCGGIRENFGTTTKPLHAGQAARAGVMAALLAQAGVGGSPTALSGRYGFLALYGEGAPVGEVPSTLDAGKLAIEGEWGIVLKPYACCGSSHPLIDATLGLMDQANPKPESIRSVTCHIDPLTASILQFHDPRTPFEARYSLEYPVAVAILDRAGNAEQFEQARVAAPDVRAMLARVKVVDDLRNPEHSVFGGEVVFELEDGSVLRKHVDHGLGHPLNPMSRAQRQAKFTSATSLVLAPEEVDRLAAALDRIEEIESVGDVVEMMVPRAAREVKS